MGAGARDPAQHHFPHHLQDLYRKACPHRHRRDKARTQNGHGTVCELYQQEPDGQAESRLPQGGHGADGLRARRRGQRRHRVHERRGGRGGRARLLARPEVHLRLLRGGQEQRIRARRGKGGREKPGRGHQPAVYLRRVGAGQDAPSAIHRKLSLPAQARAARAVHDLRKVHQRAHRQHLFKPRRKQPRPAGAVPQPLPQCGRAAHRRRAVPRQKTGGTGGAVPHLQRPAGGKQADRAHLGRAPEGDRDPRRAAAHPLRRRADRGHPAARHRDEDRHFKAEGVRAQGHPPRGRGRVPRPRFGHGRAHPRGQADEGHLREQAARKADHGRARRRRAQRGGQRGARSSHGG